MSLPVVLTRGPHTKALIHFLWARQCSPHPLPPLPSPSHGCSPCPTPHMPLGIGSCWFLWLWYFPPPLKHGIKWAACAAGKMGFFQSLCWEGPKRQPLAPQEAGCCMQQESQAAAKPEVQTLSMCTYSIGFIALLLDIYQNK